MDNVMTDNSGDNSVSSQVDSSQQTLSESNSPEPIDLSDVNRLVKLPGVEKPVKWSDHVKGFQSQFTKASQEVARLKAAMAERDRQIEAYRQSQQQAQAQPQNQAQNDVYGQLRALPYLSGERAAEVIEGIGAQFQQRDQILLAALKQMKQMQQIVMNLQENHTGTAFENKISNWLREGDYPEGIKEWAKELYLAYEGDDLDQEFPNILAKRWAEVQSAIKAQQTAKVNAARKAPFIPGKGGNTGPSKGLEIKPDASPQEIADLLWNNGWDGTRT